MVALKISREEWERGYGDPDGRLRKRVSELEAASRAALEFLRVRFSTGGTYSDGHAQMVALALTGALERET